MGTKILITGTHSTGKSTLLNELKRHSEFSSFKFIGGVTREAKSFGIDINEQGGEDTQLFCICNDVLNLLKNRENDVIFDRSIIDTYIYSKYLFLRGQISRTIMIIIRDIYLKYINSFDFIFWLRPEFEISDDGVRSINRDFQIDIDQLFEEEFLLREIDQIILSGTVEERINKIKVYVGNN